MANDLNNCQFIGRVGKDPEIRVMTNGKSVANFSIACSESWKDQQGVKQEKTEWVRLTAYGKLAEIIGQYVKKGAQLFVSGKLQTRKWQDQQGQDKYTTEIIVDQMQMLGGRQNENNQPAQQQAKPQNQQQRGFNQTPAHSKPMAEPDFDFDQDIPF